MEKVEMRIIRSITIVLAGLLLACSDDDYGSSAPPPPPPPPPPGPTATVVTASGDIRTRVEEFRTTLGVANGTTVGEQATGRREINWDGAAANPFNNRNDFPADFFNTTVKVGAIYTTSGTGFRNDSLLFSEVNPSYAAEFTAFSPSKIFAPVGSNQLDQLFQVAGQPTPALVRGFGIVFNDVDVAERTSIQLFAQDGTSLGTFSSPVRTDASGFTFVGVTFTEAVIARVRITLGTGAMGPAVNDVSAGGTIDIVALDNVIYGEPRKAF
jgi:hypothetical protein